MPIDPAFGGDEVEKSVEADEVICPNCEAELYSVEGEFYFFGSLNSDELIGEFSFTCEECLKNVKVEYCLDNTPDFD